MVPHTAPAGTRALGANDSCTSVHFFREPRLPMARRRCQRANENLGTFSFQRATRRQGERLLASIDLMPPRSKRKASREQIRSGAAFFLETSGDAPCEA